jgi:hypothetical protein
MSRYSYATTPSVEQTVDLSMSWLKKHGYLDGWKSGGMEWKQFGKKNSVGFIVDTEKMYINFFCTYTDRSGNREEQDYKAHIVSVTPHFGGKRYYFICPIVGCFKRVSVLYLPPGGKYFGCRKCHRLQYESSRQSGTKYSKLKKSLKKMDPLTRARTLHDLVEAGDFNAMRIILDEEKA